MRGFVSVEQAEALLLSELMASTKATWSRLIQRLGGVLDLASAAMNRYTAREPLMLAFPFWSASR